MTYYNAGAFGPNAGGGPYAPIAPDSGNWKVSGAVDRFFTSAAARSVATLGAPPYGTVPSTALPIYIVGDHFGGRTDNSALALRNDTAPGTGAMNYTYSIDTFDTGGIAPATVSTGTVGTKFYFCPNPDAPGQSRAEKFIMSFMDSSSNVGFQ